MQYTKQFVKSFSKLPTNAQRTITKKLAALARDPYEMQNVKKLKGFDGYRLRVGDWRIIYHIENERLVIVLMDIGARGGIYEH